MAKKKATKKPKKDVWFTRVRGSYLPANRNGWLTYIPFTILGLLPMKVIYITWRDCKADCMKQLGGALALNLLIFCVAYYLLLLFIMTWFAKRKS